VNELIQDQEVFKICLCNLARMRIETGYHIQMYLDGIHSPEWLFKLKKYVELEIIQNPVVIRII